MGVRSLDHAAAYHFHGLVLAGLRASLDPFLELLRLLLQGLLEVLAALLTVVDAPLDLLLGLHAVGNKFVGGLVSSETVR